MFFLSELLLRSFCLEVEPYLFLFQYLAKRVSVKCFRVFSFDTDDWQNDNEKSINSENLSSLTWHDRVLEIVSIGDFSSICVFSLSVDRNKCQSLSFFAFPFVVLAFFRTCRGETNERRKRCLANYCYHHPRKCNRIDRRRADRPLLLCTSHALTRGNSSWHRTMQSTQNSSSLVSRVNEDDLGPCGYPRDDLFQLEIIAVGVLFLCSRPRRVGRCHVKISWLTIADAHRQIVTHLFDLFTCDERWFQPTTLPVQAGDVSRLEVWTDPMSSARMQM